MTSGHLVENTQRLVRPEQTHNVVQLYAQLTGLPRRKADVTISAICTKCMMQPV